MRAFGSFLFILIITGIRQSVPLSSLGKQKCSQPSIIWEGDKGYYLGIYFKANWYRADQFCRYHGMHLVSISCQKELDFIVNIVKEFGIHPALYWTSGTDLAQEGSFTWTSTGRPIHRNSSLWVPGQPDNWKDNEHCVHLWDIYDYKLNDNPCSVEYHFICETSSCSNWNYVDC